MRTLVCDEPTKWVVRTIHGDELIVFADAYAIEGKEYLFDVLIDGKPRKTRIVAVLPEALVESIESR